VSVLPPLPSLPPLRALHPASLAGGLLDASVASARTGLRAGQEIASIAAHLALYPAGVLAESAALVDDRARLDPLSPVTRGLLLGDVAAAGVPVVLVHGIVDNRAAFTVIRRALQRRGYGRVTTLNYSPLTTDVAAAAERLGRHVERICDQTGYDRVNVIGHSLGGIIARYYVQRRGGDRRVGTLVTLGSPHAGTTLARLLPLPVARQLRPGAQVIRELAAPTRARCRVVSVHSDRDEIVVPNSSGRLEHPDLDVTNVAVHGVGHLALLLDPAVVAVCVDALTPPRAPSRRARVPAGAVG
jgi:triacylglycerol lipase